MMKKLVFALFVCASCLTLFSCNDEFSDEFIELSTEDPNTSGGGVGGQTDPGEPE